MKIKISEIKKKRPCKDGWDQFKSQTKKHQSLTTIEEIVNFNGVSDSLWVIGNVLKDHEALTKLSRQFAYSVEHLDNPCSNRAAFYAHTTRVTCADIAASHAVVHATSAANDARDAVYAANIAHYHDAFAAADDERKKQEQMIINYYKDK